ncbi:MAG: phosphopantetheine-binding protein [Phycicoccus sp.]
MPGPDGRPRLVAYVAPSDTDAPPTDEELTTRLRARLPDFMVPSRFIRLAAMPVTDNGKLDYAALPAAYRGASSASTSSSLPDDAAPVAERTAGLARHRPPVADRPLPTDEPPPTDGPSPDGLLVALGDAADRGLTVRLVVTGEQLDAGEALTAAAQLASVAGRLATSTHELTPALSTGAVLELTVTARDERGRSAPPPMAAEVAGPGRISDLEVERVVGDVFADLLGAPVRDVGEPFFHQGATSLTLVLAHRRLTERFHVDLTVVDLFAHPTVHGLAQLLVGRLSAQPPTESAPLPIGTPVADASDHRAARRRRARELALESGR